jgi:hypothetical protein
MADPANLRHKARHASSAALLLIGALALYNWVLSPHVGYLHAMQRLEPVVERVAEEKSRICGTVDGKLRDLRTLQRERAAVDNALFTPDQAQAFARGLLPLVAVTGCDVVRADFTDRGRTVPSPDPNAPVSIVVSPLSLEVSGQPAQITAVLERMRDHRPKVWIDSCRIDFPEARAGPLACHLVLTLYVVEQKRSRPAGDSSHGTREHVGIADGAAP